MTSDGSKITAATRLANSYRGEDRLVVLATPRGMVAVVADGAGGTGGAARAAQTVCDVVVRCAAKARGDSAIWIAALREAGHACAAFGGLSTAVIVEVFNNVVSGASVGDSGALIVEATTVVELTGHQQRKPLIGSGQSTPIAFGPIPALGRVLLASDGLLKYVQPAVIAEKCRAEDVELAASALLIAAQLPNGKYQDDVAIILIELSRK